MEAKDLIHGGLYRHKQTGGICRFNADMGYMFKVKGPTPTVIMHGPGLSGIFDPIPLTPEILTDWFGFEKDTYAHNKFTLKYRAKGMDSDKTLIFDTNDNQLMTKAEPVSPILFICAHVHELQRLYLALTGKLLEGGPK